MFAPARSWGPPALPKLLIEQLRTQGLEPGDAALCAERLAANRAPEHLAAVFVDLGACTLLAGDVDGAISCWRHAVSAGIAAPAARALLNLGLLYEHLELYPRARSVLTSVQHHGVEPYGSQAALAGARAEAAAGEIEPAMESLARLAEATMARDPNAPALGHALVGLGDLAAQIGQLDRAERAWRVAMSGPHQDIAHSAGERLAELLNSLGRDDQAIEILDSLTDVDPALRAKTVLDRCEQLVALGRLDQVPRLTNSLALGDLSTRQRLRLITIQEQIGDVNGAIDELELLLETPNGEARQRAAFLLGRIYTDHNMVDVAASMYTQVVAGGDDYWAPRAEQMLNEIGAPKPITPANQAPVGGKAFRAASDSSVDAALPQDSSNVQPENPGAGGELHQPAPPEPVDVVPDLPMAPVEPIVVSLSTLRPAIEGDASASAGASTPQFADEPTTPPDHGQLVDTTSDATDIVGDAVVVEGAAVPDDIVGQADIVGHEVVAAQDVVAGDSIGEGAAGQTDITDHVVEDIVVENIVVEDTAVENIAVDDVAVENIAVGGDSGSTEAVDPAQVTPPAADRAFVIALNRDPHEAAVPTADTATDESTLPITGNASPPSQIEDAASAPALDADDHASEPAHDSTEHDTTVPDLGADNPQTVVGDKPAADETQGDAISAVLAEPDAPAVVDEDDKASTASDEVNPYAALAPEFDDPGVSPAGRNPYAELAPNYVSDEEEDDGTGEPWDVLLEDWPDPAEDIEPPTKPKRPRAFSRYT